MPTVTEITGRNGPIETGGKGREGIKRTYVRRFRVRMDRWSDGPLRVLTAPGIPRLGETYAPPDGTIDTGARCHSVDPQDTDEPTVWTVTASYSNDPADIGDMQKEAGGAPDPNNPQDNSGDQGQSGSGSQPNDPLAKPAQIVWSVDRYTKVAQFAIKDIDTGKQDAALASAAGEPFDPLPEVDAGRLTLTITRNEPSFSQVTSALFQDKVNSDTFAGFGAGKVKCNGITGQSAEESGFSYYVVTYSFSMRDDGWRLKLLNQGMYEFAAGKRVRILDDKTKEPITSPVPLDANGAKLTVAAVQAGSFTFKNYQVYDEREFSVLNLPV